MRSRSRLPRRTEVEVRPMRCFFVNLRRKFSRYLHEKLSPRDVKQIEDHLLDCGYCRSYLTKLRSGHRLASRLPRLSVQQDRWSAIEAAIEAEQSGASGRSPADARQ